MPILGVDREKCTRCGECVADCPPGLFSKTQENAIVFDDPQSTCISCGHCIAVCPSDAIKRESMPDASSFPGIHHPDQLVKPETLLHFLQSKRSVRRFKPDKLRPEHLQAIYSAMAAACSSHNDRTLNFAIVSDSSLIKELAQKVGDAILAIPALDHLFGDWLRMKRARGGDPIFLNAPHVLLAYSPVDGDLEGLNAGVALTYGMMMAHALGIGSCWIGFASMMINGSKDLKKLAGIRGKLWGAVVLGYPSVVYQRLPPRDPIRIKEIGPK